MLNQAQAQYLDIPPPAHWYGLRRPYKIIHGLCRSIKNRTRPQKNGPTAFPFLKLPREVRDQIYSYLISEYASHVKLLDAAGHRFSDPPTLHHFRSNDILYARSPRGITVQQPHPSSGFMTIASPRAPPKDLLLVCKQIRAEIIERYGFWTAVFEVAPLTVHPPEWNFDPGYQFLAASKELGKVRRLRVRIELVDLQVLPSPTNVHFPSTKLPPCRGPLVFEDIGLERCLELLRPQTERLVKVLSERAKSLEVLTIDWKDEFEKAGDRNEAEWKMKMSVLKPFGALKGLVRVGEVAVKESAKPSTRKALNEIFEKCYGGKEA